MNENTYQPPYETTALQHFWSRFFPAAIYLVAAAVLTAIVRGIGI